MLVIFVTVKIANLKIVIRLQLLQFLILDVAILGAIFNPSCVFLDTSCCLFDLSKQNEVEREKRKKKKNPEYTTSVILNMQRIGMQNYIKFKQG